MKKRSAVNKQIQRVCVYKRAIRQGGDETEFGSFRSSRLPTVIVFTLGVVAHTGLRLYRDPLVKDTTSVNAGPTSTPVLERNHFGSTGFSFRDL